MKTWNLFCCLLCICLVFCSCDAQDTNDTQTTSVTSGTVQEEQPLKPIPLVDNDTEDAEYVSSVRSYSIAELDETLSQKDIDIFSFSDGKFYAYQNNYSAETGYLFCYGADGVYLETVSIPISLGENGHPGAVHRLKNGDVFVIYYTLDNTSMFIRRYSAAGTLLSEAVLPEAVDSYNNTRVYEREAADGTKQILVHMTSAMLVLNESLEMQSYIPYDSDYYDCIPLDENRFLLGHNAAGLRILDMETGQISPNTEIVFPDNAQNARVSLGADGKIYYYNELGIWQLQKNGTSIEVLQWINGTASYPESLWIVDDVHMFALQTVSIYDHPQLCYIQCKGELKDVKRRVITLGYMATEETQAMVTAAAAAFNASDVPYIIQLEEYSTYYVDAEAKLDEALLSGTAPDLLVCSNAYFEYDRYLDKGVFVDLLPYYKDTLLRGVGEAYTIDGHLYFFPASMEVDTIASLSSAVNEKLTYEKIQEMAETLSPDEKLVNDSGVGSDTLSNAVYDFIDFDTKSCTLASSAFADVVRLCEDLQTRYLDDESGLFLCNHIFVGRGYGVTDGQVIEKLKNGSLKFLSIPYNNIHAYAILKNMLGEDTPFTLCGYPSSEGYGARIDSRCIISLLADSDVLGGCAEFLSFLLSDEMQTSDAINENSLPVTASALRKKLSENRYYYFLKDNYFIIKPEEISAQQNKAKAKQYNYYNEVYITAEDIEAQMDFFENLHMKANMSSVINDILEEELSFWRGGVRSLSDALELAQSRVWIYLNE